jgi:hypothetical protein
MKRTHPDIYGNGPTDEMYAKWDAEWGIKRRPWSGYWPGVAECREYDFWCKWGESGGWIQCDRDDPDAREDLNRLVTECVWDVEKQRFVLPTGMTMFRLVKTCNACPEQYDVFWGTSERRIGYMRLRHGFFRTDYYHIDQQTETIYATNRCVGNGSFDPDERDEFLRWGCRAMLRAMMTHNDPALDDGFPKNLYIIVDSTNGGQPCPAT